MVQMPSIVFSLFLMGTSISLFAQELSIMSVTPEDGSTSVNTSATITVEFDKDLYPVAEYYDGNIRILSPADSLPAGQFVELWPPAKSTSNLRISGKSLSFEALLDDDQSYQVVVPQGRLFATDGSTLGRPLTILGTFTTGEVLPAASISGKLAPLISFTEHPAIVTISTSKDKYAMPHRGAEVKDDSIFTISHIEPGTYYLMARQFNSPYANDAVYEFYAGETNVEDGGVITGKDMTISPLRVVSSTPADMAVNVDTNLTISITFSEALELDRYYILGDSQIQNGVDFRDQSDPIRPTQLIGISIAPPPLSQGVHMLSEDGKTVSFPALLEGNTFYTLSLSHARSENNKYLDPLEILFSTGSAIPSGLISGSIENSVAFAGEKILVSVVNESGKSAGMAVANEDGTYQISHLEDGLYCVSATTSGYNDANGFVQFIAHYGWEGGGDDFPDAVTIGGGGSITGINLTLRTAAPLKLLSTSPGDGEVNVPAESASISFTFNLPIQPEGEPYSTVSNRPIVKWWDIDIAPMPVGGGLADPVFTDFGRTVTFSSELAEDIYYTLLLERIEDIIGGWGYPAPYVFLNPTIFGFSTGGSLPTTSISGTVALPQREVNYVAVRVYPWGADSVYYGKTGDPTGNYRGETGMGDSAIVFPPGGDDGGFRAVQAASALGLADLGTGIYSMRVPNGTYWLSAYADFIPGDKPIEMYKFYDPNDDGRPDSIEVLNNSPANIDLAFEIIDHVTLSGYVRNIRWIPAADTRIILRSDIWSGETVSDSCGVFEIRKIPSGEYILEVFPPEGSELDSQKMPLRLGSDLYTRVEIVLNSAKPHYEVKPTNMNYPIVIDHVDIYGRDYSLGDEIAAKLESGLIVGAISYSDSFPLTLHAWADDAATPEKDGFAEEDSIYFEVYSASMDREITAYAVYGEGDGRFGTGEQAHVSLRAHVLKSDAIVELPINDAGVPIRSVYENNTMIEISFQSGAVSGSRVAMRNLGDDIPSDIHVENMISNVAGYYLVEAALEDTFTARITFGYTDSILTVAGIREENLVIVNYDSVREEWRTLPTEVDSANKVASAVTNHFSLWALTDKNNDGIVTVVEDARADNGLPDDFSLHQNYPNPFNPSTIIRFAISRDSFVELNIYSILGRKIRTLTHANYYAGEHSITWNGKNDDGMPAASGIYFYQLRAGNSVNTKKMLLLK